MNKNVQAGINYNISRLQRSFPFVGVSGRVAQFEGMAYKQEFILNKYYVHLNLGYMLRTKEGISFLFMLGPGHYFNHYLSHNPNFRVSDPGINALNFSIQLGYSF